VTEEIPKSICKFCTHTPDFENYWLQTLPVWSDNDYFRGWCFL